MKTKRQHRCDACGHLVTQWLGRCPSCGGWGTLQPEDVVVEATRRSSLSRPPDTLVLLGDVPADDDPRRATGCGEMDRVLGGGLVAGSVVLVGGEPGVGKSTLLLQVAQSMAAAGGRVMYVSGEESPRQLRMRADRLGLTGSTVAVLAATQLDAIQAEVEAQRPEVVVVDSIQTVRSAELDSAAGSLGQVRECAARLAELAKRLGTAMVLVGHVTKDGGLAGPKVMEHIVDAVLIFEGERVQALKVLRATKNRYGSTNEVGLFEMTTAGLREVANPSQWLLEERATGLSGTVACCVLEGTRPLVLEIQALVAPTPFAAPRRVANGLDTSRLHLLLAVMEQHTGIRLAQQDVYVNVAGGVRITEPAADLAVVAAVASSALSVPLPADEVVYGEVGLTGEVRAVTWGERRLEEAARLGFRTALVPWRRGGVSETLAVHPVRSVRQAVARLSGEPAGWMAIESREAHE